MTSQFSLRSPKTAVKGLALILCSCMRSLREPLLEAELSRDRKSSLWIFATEIMVRISYSLFSGKAFKQRIMWFCQCDFIRSHSPQSKSPSQSSCFSALWRKASKLTTISSKSQKLVWPIYYLCSSSPKTAFHRSLGEMKSPQIRSDWWHIHYTDQTVLTLLSLLSVTSSLHCTVSCCSSPVFILQCNMKHINQLLSRYTVNTVGAECKFSFRRIDFLM